MEPYVERPPQPGLAGVVRTVWIQRTGEAAYVKRHLPTGGVEIHFPIGGQPRLLGPLTGPEVEVIPAHATVVGVRFQPGAAPPLPTVLDDLVDQHVGLAELWENSADRLVGGDGRGRTLLRNRVHAVLADHGHGRPAGCAGAARRGRRHHPLRLGAQAGLLGPVGAVRGRADDSRTVTDDWLTPSRSRSGGNPALTTRRARSGDF